MRMKPKTENTHIQYKCCGHPSTETVQTHIHKHIHTHTHARALTHTHSHLVSQPLQPVDAVLSAELLEVLRDGVCGGQETSSEQGRGRANAKHSYCSLA